MTTAEPTASELMRRLDEVVVRLDRLASQMYEGYVRKDVQQVNDAATALHVKSVEDGLHLLTKQFNAMVTQRDNERDERDRQRSSDRRLFYVLAVSVFIGPLLVAVLLHALKVN